MNKETDGQLLERLGMDAAAWAKEMSERGIVQADPTPGGAFHGWMCNAIMRAYDTGHQKGFKDGQAFESDAVMACLV